MGTKWRKWEKLNFFRRIFHKIFKKSTISQLLTICTHKDVKTMQQI